MADFGLTIITPSETLVDNEQIESINVKTIAGEMTALKNHSPILSGLVPGKLHYFTLNNTKKFVTVNSGIIKVNKFGVTIIANSAEFVKE